MTKSDSYFLIFTFSRRCVVDNEQTKDGQLGPTPLTSVEEGESEEKDQALGGPTGGDEFTAVKPWLGVRWVGLGRIRVYEFGYRAIIDSSVF